MKDKKMRENISIVLFCLLALFAGGIFRALNAPATARAAIVSLPASTGRYTLTASEYGLWFLDTQTGHLWFRSTSWGDKPGLGGTPGWHTVASPAVASPVNVPSGRPKLFVAAQTK